MKEKDSKMFWNRFLSNPARVIVISFAVVILLGTILLMMPISTNSGQSTGFMEALFTATSATTGTGLVVFDTGTYFNLFGQILIMIMIQFGGIGLVMFVTFFNLLLRKRVSLKSLNVAQESISSGSMYDMGHLVKMVLKLTFAMEGVGALLLMIEFVPKYELYGVFISLFLSVSSYCTAGFDVLGMEGVFSSLTHYCDNPLVMCTIIALSVGGGLGFIVWQDIYYFKQRKRLTLHTKIVVFGSLALGLTGAVMIALLEWNNPETLGELTVGQKLLNSLFMAVSARTTTGFNTIAVEPMTGVTKFVVMFLMFIGAAPGSTGAGIKVTTAYVLLMTVICTLSGKEDTIIGKRKVDKSVVYKAMAVLAVTFLTVFISFITILLTSSPDSITSAEIPVLFEAVAAIGTGMSNGVILETNPISRLAIIITMLIGRVGPVSMALSLAMRPQKKNMILPEAKIMVG